MKQEKKLLGEEACGIKLIVIIVVLLSVLIGIWTSINNANADGLCRELGLNKSIDRSGLTYVQCNDNIIYKVICFPEQDKWGYDTLGKKCHLYK